MQAEDDLLAESAERLLSTQDGDLHPAMAELGWYMLPFGEADGGLMTDERDSDLLSLFTAFGRHVRNPQSLFQLVLGGTILSAASAWPRRSAVLSKLMDGSLRVATALREPETRTSFTQLRTRARRAERDWMLSGTKTLAIGAQAADLIVFTASVEGSGLGLFAVDRSVLADRLRHYRLRDGQDAADLLVDDLTVGEDTLLLSGEQAVDALERALDRTRRCLAAEGAGLIAHALDRSGRYVGERQQFGRPIGEFQVIQHRLADMACARAQAEALVRQMSSGEAPASSEALAINARLAMDSCKSAVQLHGAMGMTEELPLGQALRRAMTLSLMFCWPPL